KPRKQRLQRFRLGAWPGAVEDDIACGPGKAAHVDAGRCGIVSEVEREPGNALHDVERAARSILREEAGIIDRRATSLRGAGLRQFSAARSLADGGRRR